MLNADISVTRLNENVPIVMSRKEEFLLENLLKIMLQSDLTLTEIRKYIFPSRPLYNSWRPMEREPLLFYSLLNCNDNYGLLKYVIWFLIFIFYFKELGDFFKTSGCIVSSMEYTLHVKG